MTNIQSQMCIQFKVKDIDKVYEQGSTIAKLRSNKVIGDSSAEFIISAEKQGSGYLRGINDTDRVLNYRKGYFQVQYKDPKFIDKVVYDSADPATSPFSSVDAEAKTVVRAALSW